MEWLKKLLESKSITITDEVMSEVQKEIPMHFIPKGEYNLKLDEIKGLKDQIKTRDDDITDLKKQAKGNEDLQNQIKTLQDKYDKDTADLQGNLNQTKFNSALEIALSKSGAKSTKALKGLLDMDKIKYENDTLSGLDDQLESIKADNDYLFGDGKPSGSTGSHHQSGGLEMTDAFISSARAAAGLKE